jgi:hypothetical protein
MLADNPGRGGMCASLLSKRRSKHTSQIERWKEDFDVATAENWLDAMFGCGKMRVRDGHIPVAGKNCKVFGKSRLAAVDP